MLAPDGISHAVGSITLSISKKSQMELKVVTAQDILVVPLIGIILDSKLTFNKHIDSIYYYYYNAKLL